MKMYYREHSCEVEVYSFDVDGTEFDHAHLEDAIQYQAKLVEVTVN